jgi:hypothetical protein
MVRRSSGQGFQADVDLRLRQGTVPARVARLVLFLAKALRTYDVFHLKWGMSLLDFRQWSLNYLELPLLKRCAKRIVMTFQGCDARMRTRSQELFSTSACAGCDVQWCTPRMDAIRQRRIRKVFRYADKVFALNPDLLHVLPEAEFLPYASVDPREWRAAPTPDTGRGRDPERNGPVRILHMPTNRSIKGTAYVERACTDLQRTGHPVTLALVEQVAHSQVKALIEEADIVVDQLLIGWYGAFAVEAMALGKPVLCYLREADLKLFVSFHDQIPIVRTTRETLTDDLARLLSQRPRWQELGRAGRRFVETCHDPLKIARQTIAAYEGAPAATPGSVPGPLG